MQTTPVNFEVGSFLIWGSHYDKHGPRNATPADKFHVRGSSVQKKGRLGGPIRRPHSVTMTALHTCTDTHNCSSRVCGGKRVANWSPFSHLAVSSAPIISRERPLLAAIQPSTPHTKGGTLCLPLSLSLSSLFCLTPSLHFSTQFQVNCDKLRFSSHRKSATSRLTLFK